MPLKSGSSEAVIQDNIAELVRAYRRTGKIGNTTPKNAQHAREIATAIANEKAKGG